MPPVVVCCRDLLLVTGWLVAALASGGAGTSPATARSGPAVSWHVPGEGRGMPAVHGRTVYFLSKRHELLAVDALTGRVRWRRPTDGPGAWTMGSGVVATSTAVVAGDYDVVAFDHDGARLWRFAPPGGYGAGVYLGDAVGEAVFTGSPSGHLVAIDVRSGAARWVLQLGVDGQTTVFAPAVAGTTVIAGFTSFHPVPSGGLSSVDATSGQLRWRRPLPATTGLADAGPAMAGGPHINGDLVLAAGGDGGIHGFDVKSGALRWSLPPVVTTGGETASSPPDYRVLASSGRVLVAGSLTGIVAAYDLDTRKERWRRAPVEASVAGGLATDGRTVYVPYFSGHLVALDVADGRERWRVGGDRSGFTWKPLVFGGRVFAAASAAGFFAFGGAFRPPSRDGRR